MTELLTSIAAQAVIVRSLQRKYFKTRDRFYMHEAMVEEKKLDALLAKYIAKTAPPKEEAV